MSDSSKVREKPLYFARTAAVIFLLKEYTTPLYILGKQDWNF